MLKKPLVLAVIATTLAAATLPTRASAGGDPLLGALVGGGIGAAIGHGVNGRDGAWVGGALGAITGASIAAASGGYYGQGYYDQGYYGTPAAGYPPAPAYYGAPAVSYPPAVYIGSPRTYYRPAPVYYGRPTVIYGPRPIPVGHYTPYARPYPPRYPAGGTHVPRRHNGQEGGRNRWPDRYDGGGR